jgi:hypothetical protein
MVSAKGIFSLLLDYSDFLDTQPLLSLSVRTLPLSGLLQQHAKVVKRQLFSVHGSAQIIGPPVRYKLHL